MVETPPKTPPPEAPPPPKPLGESLTEEGYLQVLDLLKGEKLEDLSETLNALHPSDLADLLERLPMDAREQAFACISSKHRADVLVELAEGVQETLLEAMSSSDMADTLDHLESDDVADLVQHLRDERVEEVLAAISPEEQELLRWPEDTAGGLMQLEVLALPKNWTVGKVFDHMRETAEKLPDVLYNVYVINRAGRLQGSISLSRLVRQNPTHTLEKVMRTDPVTVAPETPQEEVVRIFEKYDVSGIAVVDENRVLLGRITIDDVIDTIMEDYEKAIMRSAGLGEGEDLFAPVMETTKRRFPWLFVNLITAISASIVIGIFEEDIARLVALAVLMPIVASMGGNAGTQTLTVTVRGLAMKKITPNNMFLLLKKELLAGTFNGLLLALLVGLGAAVVYRDPALGAVICAATVANHVFAALAGHFVPILINRFGGDPAISSGVLVTTVTDVGGFFVFLGLASLLLL